VFEVAEEAIRLHRDAFGDNPVLRDMLDAGGEYAYRVRRRPHVDAGFDRQAPARDAQQLVPDVQGIRALINDQTKRHMTLRGLFEFKVDPARSRSTTSSRRRKSSSASPRARCRSARSAPKRTRRSRSR
jgi:glutamate synthase (ferredoxin)